MSPQGILVVALITESFGMYWLDRQLRAHRAPEVHEDSLGHPLSYWGRPELFTARGQQIRWAIISLLWLGFFTVVGLALTAT